MDYLEKGLHFGKNESILLINGIILNKAKVLKSAEIPWHYHENAYFLYNLDGHLQEVSKKGTADLKPGSLLYHHVQEPHYNKNIAQDVNFLHVELTPDWYRRYDLKPDILEGNLQLDNPYLKSIFEKIGIETGISSKASAFTIEGLVLQAFGEIMKSNDDKKNHKAHWIQKACEIINDEKWENLSLNYLAGELGLHPVYLSRKFPEHFQMNFGDYVREKKIQKAITLLKNKSYSSIDIAYQCGFADESHFNKVFKTKFGITPAHYKKKL